MSDGIFDVGNMGAYGTVRLGNAADSSATYSQTGGSSTFDGLTNGIALGYANGAQGTMRLEGGTMTFSRGYLMLGASNFSSVGTFEVIGSAGAVVATNAGLTMWTAEKSVLRFVLDSSTNHITTLEFGTTTLTGGTIDIALDGYNFEDEQHTFDLLKDLDGEIDISNLVLSDAAKSAGWSLQVNDGGDTLQAVIPEPATMALLGVGMVALVARRRRAK
jgi:hypothetical protein